MNENNHISSLCICIIPIYLLPNLGFRNRTKNTFTLKLHEESLDVFDCRQSQRGKSSNIQLESTP